MKIIFQMPETDVGTGIKKKDGVGHHMTSRKKRFSARFDARLRLLLDSSDSMIDVVVMDLSIDGVSAAVASDFGEGSLVRLEIPLVGWRDAEVRWLKDGRAGCRFIVPLTEAELRTAVADSQLIRDNFPGLAAQLDDV